MAQEFLHGPNIVTRFQQMRCEAVAKCMGTERLRKARRPRRLLYSPLRTVVADMLAPADGVCR